jgi:hypothetical protein
MYNPCIAELGEMVDGRVHLAVMPPLAGMFEPIGQIVCDRRDVRPRDVLCAFTARDGRDELCYVDEAFSRGALGVILAGRRIEPWAGKFCVTVPDLAVALHRLMRCLQRDDGTWPAGVFGEDEHTRRLLSAVWGRDPVALQEAVESLTQRPASVA